MSKSSSGSRPQPSSVAVSIGDRLATSEHFAALFKEGMALVERTAAYLDGEGRRAAKGLQPPLSVTYATESMRLTTRLLEVASWLLIRRALNAGELTPSEAAAKRARVKLRAQGRPSHIANFAALPVGLQLLIEQSFRLTDRVIQLDRSLRHGVAEEAQPALNPVAAQMAHLQSAFGSASTTCASQRKLT